MNLTKVGAHNRATNPICLVKPPAITSIGTVSVDSVLPLGLAYLASSLEAAGYKTVGVDAVGEAINQFTLLPGFKNTLLHGLTGDEIVQRIPQDTDVIGVTCMFSCEWIAVKHVLDEIRRSFPNALIVVGGEHVTAVPQYIIETCEAVDVCALGEGEETLVDLVNAYYEARRFSEVPGICYRLDGKAQTNARRQRINDLDSIPNPNWDIFPTEEYIDQHVSYGADLGRSMALMVSRGCPYECTFCSSPLMWTRRWDARTPELVLDEIQGYMRKYGATNFDFYDLTAIIKKEWIVEFGKLIVDRGLKITWQLPSGTRSEAIDDETCKYLYESGCRLMHYAPESGSAAELKRIKKKVNLEKMIDSMKSARRHNIMVKANFINGLPGSTWADVFKTFGFITRLAWIGLQEITAVSFCPYPGTELFTQLIKEGKIELNDDYFRRLVAYTDYSQSTSFNKVFGPRTLFVINMSAMAWFFGLSFLFRPKRFWDFLKGLLASKSETKLTKSFENVKRKVRARQEINKQGVATVVLAAKCSAEPSGFSV